MYHQVFYMGSTLPSQSKHKIERKYISTKNYKELYKLLST